MSLFPMFVKLEGRQCLVVGAGTIAQSKIESLLQANASVHVVAPHANEAVIGLAKKNAIRWRQKVFEPADLENIFLAIVATSSREVNHQAYAAAHNRNILCNVVDDPDYCDFYYPAVVRRGKLQFAISTEGNSPALAQKLRRQLETQYGPEYEQWVEELGEARRQLFATDMDPQERRRRLHELAGNEPIPGEVPHAR